MRGFQRPQASGHRKFHSASTALRSCRRRLRLAASSVAVAVTVALAGMVSPAAAQAADSCEKATSELLTLGQKNPSYKEGMAPEEVVQLALNELATRPSPLLVNLSKTLSGPGLGLVAFEDNRINALKDASKVCIRAFARPGESGKWGTVPIRQVYLTEKTGEKPQRLNVSFQVGEPPKALTYTQYLFVGALSDTAPILSFSHVDTVMVIGRCYAIILALLFVAVFYGILAGVTYNQDTASLAGPTWLFHTLSPIRISAAWFGEASMSQLQLLLFTLIVAGLLFYHWLTAGILSEISTNLLILIGISAVGTGASKFAQTVKTSVKDQTARYLIGKGWYSWEQIPARSHATLRNLLLTDGRLDIYKFQMAIFTVVVAFYVIAAGQASLVDVNISETMLYLIGISQGVYVGGKAVTDRTTDLEAAVQKMIDLESQIHVSGASSGAARTAALVALDGQYANAATTAAVEFTALQNRKFPTKFESARRRVDELQPKITPLQAKLTGGAALTSDEQALKDEFDQADMTAKEFAAFKEPARDLAVQDIKNIDPAVLRP